MSTDVPLRCQCGKLRGSALGLSPTMGTRVMCYCGDCQAFARFLGRPDITNRWGGTDIFQMPPSKVRIEHDDDALRCVRLSEKGMHRWYCRHCKTPVGNTLGARMPFVGLIHTFIDHDHAAVRGDDLLGKPIQLHTQAALRSVDGHPRADRTAMLRVIARTARKLARWWITGAGTPSPFFDARTGAPRTRPQVLSAAERQALGIESSRTI